MPRLDQPSTESYRRTSTSSSSSPAGPKKKETIMQLETTTTTTNSPLYVGDFPDEEAMDEQLLELDDLDEDELNFGGGGGGGGGGWDANLHDDDANGSGKGQEKVRQWEPMSQAADNGAFSGGQMQLQLQKQPQVVASVSVTVQGSAGKKQAQDCSDGTNIAKPNVNDVLVGRGKGHYNYSGNENFRTIIHRYKVEYKDFNCDADQQEKLCRNVIDYIRSLDPPGRFLQQNKATGGWQEIGEKNAIKKTRAAFRDANAKPAAAAAATTAAGKKRRKAGGDVPAKRTHRTGKEMEANSSRKNSSSSPYPDGIAMPSLASGALPDMAPRANQGTTSNVDEAGKIVPQPHDVMCMRGRTTESRPGNRAYRKLISDNCLRYSNAAGDDRGQSDICGYIVNEIEKVGGRFVQLDDKTRQWKLVERKKVASKTRQALRDMARARQLIAADAQRRDQQNRNNMATEVPLPEPAVIPELSNTNLQRQTQSAGKTFPDPQVQSPWLCGAYEQGNVGMSGGYEGSEMRNPAVGSRGGSPQDVGYHHGRACQPEVQMTQSAGFNGPCHDLGDIMPIPLTGNEGGESFTANLATDPVVMAMGDDADAQLIGLFSGDAGSVHSFSVDDSSRDTRRMSTASRKSLGTGVSDRSLLSEMMMALDSDGPERELNWKLASSEALVSEFLDMQPVKIDSWRQGAVVTPNMEGRSDPVADNNAEPVILNMAAVMEPEGDASQDSASQGMIPGARKPGGEATTPVCTSNVETVPATPQTPREPSPQVGPTPPITPSMEAATEQAKPMPKPNQDTTPPRGVRTKNKKSFGQMLESMRSMFCCLEVKEGDVI